MKTSELSGAALNWAVAKCEFPEPDYTPDDWAVYIAEGCCDDGWVFNPSTDWAQGGPIIEREEISISREFASGRIEWAAWTPAPIRDDAEAFGYGPTPLIAAMRCYVASTLGEKVTLPDELMEVLR